MDNNTEILKLVTLFIYGIIGRKEDIPMLKFLVGHEEDQVWKEASRALLKIENRLGKNEYFEELVLQLPHKMLVGEKLKILHQIKLALYSNPQPANLKSVFLKELELAHLFNQYDIKLKLLQLLGAVPDIEVAEVLAKYAQEQNNWNILSAVEESYPKIKYVLKKENK